MKKWNRLIVAGAFCFCFLTACQGTSEGGSGAVQSENAEETSQTEEVTQSEVEAEAEEPSEIVTAEEGTEAMRIRVRANGNEIIFELNDSAAARGLYDQLPLTLENEDFSNNEKTFYPPEALDVSDAPMADGGMGTLAYYEPWGDVVMFYGSYQPNASLYELGNAVSGSEFIEAISGEIEISAVEAEPAGGEGGSEQSGEDVLIAYFPWAENAVLEGEVDAVASPSVNPPGNVQQLAGWVQEATGGDLFSIRVTDPYPSDWDECLSRANEERGDDARPELAEHLESIDQYDTVFLGYSNWWYGVPMALLTFLEENDLSGKQVYLFCSHGTGGLANSVEIITEAAPGADISDQIFDGYEEDAPSSQGAIQNWVAELGY